MDWTLRYSGRSQMVEGRNFPGQLQLRLHLHDYAAANGNIPDTVAKNSSRKPFFVRPGARFDGGRFGFAHNTRKPAGATIRRTQTCHGRTRPNKERRLCRRSDPGGNAALFQCAHASEFKGWSEVSGRGFTMQKLSQPTQTRENVGGQTYEVFTFKTAIAAARPGRFDIGPVKATATVAVPRAAGSGGRSPFDIFNGDDPFADPFFADPFSNIYEKRDVDIESKPATLEVKSLPGNAPRDFSGAIGSFTMEADAKPKTAQVGDPITVTAQISGRGNFDRVTAPLLEEEQGWHKYPPSSNFKQDDDIGMSGVKNFEMVLTPNESKKNVPTAGLLYFDPVNEKYVTLRSNAIPVRIEGAAIAAQPGVAASVPTPDTTPKPPAKPEDILYQINEWPGTARSFAPIYTRSDFWLAQIVPLIGLLGFVGWKVRQAKLSDREKTPPRGSAARSGRSAKTFAARRCAVAGILRRGQRAPCSSRPRWQKM